jgi:3-oxoadipate enol-lactonase
MPFADANGQTIYYEITGETGPVVLFSHGFLMDHEMFAAQVEALSEEFRCITWDERGFGDTTFTAPFDYWDSARDALALLTELGVDAAFFVGMSQGGFLSMRAALLEPGRVLGMGLIDTQAGTEDAAVVPVYEAMTEQWATEGPSDELAEAVASIIMSPGYDHSAWVAKWQAWPKERIRDPFATLVGRDDIHDRLPQIDVPAIVFHGEDDAAIPMSKAETLCSQLPRCDRLVRIPGAGHAANLSHPDEVNGPLREFLHAHS